MMTHRIESGTEGVNVHFLGRCVGSIHCHELWCVVYKRLLQWDRLGVREENSAYCRIRASVGHCNVTVVLDANDGLELRVSVME